jgi:hypothetical protein
MDIDDLCILRIDPVVAVQLNEGSPFYAWVYKKGGKELVPFKRLNPIELNTAKVQIKRGIIHADNFHWMEYI